MIFVVRNICSKQFAPSDTLVNTVSAIMIEWVSLLLFDHRGSNYI